MTPDRISRSYKRTVEVSLPNGNKAWLTHEAGMEAEISPAETQEVGACYEQLEEICIAEVSSSLAAEKKKLADACAAANGGVVETSRPRLS